VIAVEPLDDLVVLRLERPEKRNAMTRPLIAQLRQALERVGAQAEVRGVILDGAGPSFCAGVDLHEFAEGTPDAARALISALADLCRTVRQSPKPLACAIQGHCLGGALELAACCDFRVCAPDAQLGMPEVFLGIPSVIDAVMLVHLVGAGRARELLLTGDSISGETAYQWGLATRLATPQDLIEVAADLLRRVARHDADAIATQRRLHQQWLDLAYTEAVARSQQALIDAFETGTPQRVAAARLRR